MTVPLHEMVAHALSYPGKDCPYPELMALWDHWWVEVRGADAPAPDAYHRGYAPLVTLISAARLYPLFRKTFESLGLAVAHPRSMLVAGEDTKFVPSGQKLVVRRDETIYLRPTGQDVSESVWLTATIRVQDQQVAHQDRTEPTVTCQIDPLSLHLVGDVYRQLNVEGGTHHFFSPELIASIVAVGIDEDTLPLAIAQIQNLDAAQGLAVFELSSGVEQFTP
jgi:hypothetical protein